MSKITSDQLHTITTIIKGVVLNDEIMFSDMRELVLNIDGQEYDIIDLLVSLHNVLYVSVTGDPYDYMHHWANKIGCIVDDDIFADMYN